MPRSQLLEFVTTPEALQMGVYFLMGRSVNGWLEWKSPQGKTLDEVKRQSIKAAD